MGCERWREAISAGLDGEADPGETVRTEEHVAACVACRAWLDRAAVVTRRVRTGPVDPAPDLVTALLGPAPRTACGCAATCGCGCQEGRACRCTPQVA